MVTWRPGILGVLPASPALFSCCHISGPFELVLSGRLEVLGGCRKLIVCCIISCTPWGSQSSGARQPLLALGSCTKAATGKSFQSEQIWKCVKAVLCRGISRWDLSSFETEIIGTVEAAAHCSKSQFCCPQLSSDSRCHQGALSLLVCVHQKIPPESQHWTNPQQLKKLITLPSHLGDSYLFLVILYCYL